MLTLLLVAWACSAGRGSSSAGRRPTTQGQEQRGAPETPQAAPAPPEASAARQPSAEIQAQDSITGLVSPQGGTVSLAGVGSVAFPAGAFRSPQHVALYSTASSETRRDWEATGALLSDGPRVPNEFRIILQTPPTTDCRIVMVVPEEFVRGLASDLEVGLFAQFFQDGGQEILDSFERLLPAAFDRRARTVQAALPRGAFTDRRRRDRKFEAVLVISAMPR